MDDLNEEWQRKGSSFSDKSARAEFGLTQDEILEAIDNGSLHYRVNATHGNPWFRLLRREVEDFVRTRSGEQHVRQVQAKAELAKVNRELKRLRAQVTELEQRRAQLLADLEG